MWFDELQQAMRVHDLYDQLNLHQRGRVWTREEFMLGFVGDVGDLAKLVMAEEGAREVPGGRAALEHELADCLWSVLILAHRYDVDLEVAFRRTMAELGTAINTRLPKNEGAVAPAGPANLEDELREGAIGQSSLCSDVAPKATPPP
ncbi:nucleotide pyrophosphohydrolase [Streptomyces botrytidirepellens]|uniref:Nucleotide pyrophosphohydrolase n=1 Tax=Streptomyces botrytidirepellens TaxID=2486417 RepID=A0A3M8W9L4_9ACTN|nr:nucleotide pyrophosphohydrolase [Streptomyces botrytidirepellens]